jgi:magnesium-transporting ATPase (P-type)
MARTMSAQASVRKEKAATGKLWWVSILAGVVAAVLNIIVMFIANATGVVLEVDNPQMGTMVVDAAPIAIFSFVPALGAGLLLWLLDRFTARPFTIFWIISGVFLLLSLIPDFTTPMAPGAPFWLALMHFVAAAPIVGLLSTLGRER